MLSFSYAQALNIQFQSVKEPRLVVSIDFGTYASGFALQWRSNFKKKDIIFCKSWELGTFLTYKTVTCLLLDPDKSFQAFGHDAERRFSEPGFNDDRHEPNEDWYFFRHFKMSLYHFGVSKYIHTLPNFSATKFLLNTSKFVKTAVL